MTENELPSEYDVKYLSSREIEGKLCLYSGKLVFEPKEELAERIEIPIAKIRDARFATEEDISALNVFLLGATLGVLAKKKHKMLTIDVEDELGIILHLTFEGNDIEEAIEEIYEIRKARKLEGKPESSSEKLKVPEMYLTKQASEQKFYWKCPRCFRQNAMKANICTRCGFEKPEKST